MAKLGNGRVSPLGRSLIIRYSRYWHDKLTNHSQLTPHPCPWSFGLYYPWLSKFSFSLCLFFILFWLKITGIQNLYLNIFEKAINKLFCVINARSYIGSVIMSEAFIFYGYDFSSLIKCLRGVVFSGNTVLIKVKLQAQMRKIDQN